jgi:hypothetical protein
LTISQIKRNGPFFTPGTHGFSSAGNSQKRCTFFAGHKTVATGAGTATVTRVLAERVNEGAAPGDVVTARALEARVERIDKPYRPEPGRLEREKQTHFEPGQMSHNQQPPKVPMKVVVRLVRFPIWKLSNRLRLIN